jgi:hypothetical protein
MMADDLTNTDKKIMFSDHDLLVRVNTILDVVVEQQREFNARYERGHADLVQRITALEVRQAAHMETTRGHADDILSLQKKTTMFDVINAAATAVVAALAIFWKR